MNDAPTSTGAAFSETQRLLNLDFRSDFFKLLLNGFGLVLRHAFLDGLGGGFDQVLRFLQSQAGNLTNGLDNVNLLVTEIGERDRELGFLFRRRTK